MHASRLSSFVLLTVFLSLVVQGPAPAAADPPMADRRTTTGAVAGVSAPIDVADSGLVTTITSLTPSRLLPGRRVTIEGVLANRGKTRWRDAQVYLAMSDQPATTEAELAEIGATPDGPIGPPVLNLGQFAELGKVPPGESREFRVSVPFKDLAFAGTTGVYRIGVAVFATSRQGRDTASRASTMIGFVKRGTELQRTGVVLLAPITAGVHRNRLGAFADESVGALLEPGGRLRNLVDLASSAPEGAFELVVDPAVLDAASDMADGYTVRSNQQIEAGTRGVPGRHQVAASTWLSLFEGAARQQQVAFLPYGLPDINALVDARLRSVVEAALSASTATAQRLDLPARLIAYAPDGFMTKRALSTGIASTDLAVVAEETLPSLVDPVPPALAIATRRGPVRALVSRHLAGGQPVLPTTTLIELRQQVLASALATGLTTGLSTDTTADHRLVVTTPLDWDPGPSPRSADFFDLYAGSEARPVTAGSEAALAAVSYIGRVEPAADADGIELTTDQLDAVARLVRVGRTSADLRADPAEAGAQLNERLALAGSSHWRTLPALGEALTQAQVVAAIQEVAKVTVTGPSFVAMSSDSGRFPLTVSNGTRAPIVVRVNVRPLDPGLKISPLADIRLEPGQRRDIEVSGNSQGSGLTEVQVRLFTVSGRPLGQGTSVDVRATRIGLFIWIVMGVGAVILFGASAFRIVRRVRGARRNRAVAAA